MSLFRCKSWIANKTMRLTLASASLLAADMRDAAEAFVPKPAGLRPRRRSQFRLRCAAVLAATVPAIFLAHHRLRDDRLNYCGQSRPSEGGAGVINAGANRHPNADGRGCPKNGLADRVFRKA